MSEGATARGSEDENQGIQLPNHFRGTGQGIPCDFHHHKKQEYRGAGETERKLDKMVIPAAHWRTFSSASSSNVTNKHINSSTLTLFCTKSTQSAGTALSLTNVCSSSACADGRTAGSLIRHWLTKCLNEALKSPSSCGGKALGIRKITCGTGSAMWSEEQEETTEREEKGGEEVHQRQMESGYASGHGHMRPLLYSHPIMLRRTWQDWAQAFVSLHHGQRTQATSSNETTTARVANGVPCRSLGWDHPASAETASGSLTCIGWILAA